MLKMMAADNDEAYNLTPEFILEALEAAREFVIKQGERNVTPTSSPFGLPALAPKIATFLAWPKERVSHALAQLADFEPDEETKEPTLSREAVKQLPTLHAATVVLREVKKAKQAGTPISAKKQVETGKKASDISNKSVEIAAGKKARQDFQRRLKCG